MPSLMPMEQKQFYILSALAQAPMNGYAIQQSIQDDSGLRIYVPYTSVYRILEQLTRRGLVTSAGGGQYAITKQGSSQLRSSAATYLQASQRALARLS